jgi:hypothetical protein
LESMMKLELAAGVDVDIKQYWEKGGKNDWINRQESRNVSNF